MLVNKQISLFKPSVEMTESQISQRNKIYEAIKNKDLAFHKSSCFCGHKNTIKLLSYDAWGFGIPTVMCSKCFTLRAKYFMDDASIEKFYDKYYFAHMFTSSSSKQSVGMDESEYINEEYESGKNIYKTISKYKTLTNNTKVLEVGCGAGGALKYFSENDCSVYGCDFASKYLELAQDNNPEGIFKFGSFDKFSNEKFDVVIISDVVEHLIDPESFFKDLRGLLNKDSVVYINVPGVFGIGNNRFRCSFRYFTKIEHTWLHTKQSLDYLLSRHGLFPLYSSQSVIGIYSFSEKGESKKPNLFYFLFSITFLLSLPFRKVFKIDKYVFLLLNKIRSIKKI